MNILRLALTVASLILLVGGYAASQIAVFTGQTADYAKRIDQPPIQALSLILLVAAVLLPFFPETEQEDKDS